MVHIFQEELWEGGELDWENEGGNVALNPYTFKPEKPQKEVEYLFTCLISEAIKQVNKFRLARRDTHRVGPPTEVELIGEFATTIRRLVKDRYDYFSDWGLASTQLWQAVAIPNPLFWRAYRLESQRMTAELADTLCRKATAMAEGEKTPDEEFRELNARLNSLISSSTSLDIQIQRAKNINMETSVVLESLYLVAQDLEK